MKHCSAPSLVFRDSNVPFRQVDTLHGSLKLSICPVFQHKFNRKKRKHALKRRFKRFTKIDLAPFQDTVNSSSGRHKETHADDTGIAGILLDAFVDRWLFF